MAATIGKASWSSLEEQRLLPRLQPSISQPVPFPDKLKMWKEEEEERRNRSREEAKESVTVRSGGGGKEWRNPCRNVTWQQEREAPTVKCGGGGEAIPLLYKYGIQPGVGPAQMDQQCKGHRTACLDHSRDQGRCCPSSAGLFDSQEWSKHILHCPPGQPWANLPA